MIEIVTDFAFPHADKRLPLYGMELVALGRRPAVGALDLLDLHTAPELPAIAAPIMASAHESFPELPYCEDQPEWFKQCPSGQDFFVRSEAMATLLRLLDVHHHVFRCLARLEKSYAEVSDSARHSSAIEHYKRHHRANSPGLPLLNRVFGDSWTNSYLDGYLFA